jgi:hypothetical protein
MVSPMDGQLSGTHGFVDDIARWRQAVKRGLPRIIGSFRSSWRYCRRICPRSRAHADRLREAWASRTFRIFYDRPLLFIAALRMDALVTEVATRSGPRSRPEPIRTASAKGAAQALASDCIWQSLRTKYVQTNETSRAVAWLWPAQIIGCGEGARPLALVEVGTAAG